MLEKLMPTIRWTVHVVFSTKWRTAAFILMATLAFAGYFVWHERSFFLEQLRPEPERTIVDPDKFVRLSEDLLRRNGRIDTTILWRVRMSRNQRTALVLSTRDTGRVTALKNAIAPVFTEDAEENKYILKMLNGELFCGDLITASSVGQYLRQQGVTTLGRIGVVSDGLLIGYITVAFKDPPEFFEQTKAEMRAMAQAVTTRVKRSQFSGNQTP